MLRTKAIHLENFYKFLETQGPGARERVLSQLTPEDRRIVDRSVLINSWLEYNLWWRLLQAADTTLGQGNGNKIRELGAFDARQSLKGIYRVFVALFKPEFLISRASMIWRLYYDAGRMQVCRIESKRAELHLLDLPGLPVGHEYELLGWMEAALQLAGALAPEIIHTQCLAKGDPHCTFLAGWR